MMQQGHGYLEPRDHDDDDFQPARPRVEYRAPARVALANPPVNRAIAPRDWRGVVAENDLEFGQPLQPTADGDWEGRTASPQRPIRQQAIQRYQQSNERQQGELAIQLRVFLDNARPLAFLAIIVMSTFLLWDAWQNPALHAYVWMFAGLGVMLALVHAFGGYEWRIKKWAILGGVVMMIAFLGGQWADGTLAVNAVSQSHYFGFDSENGNPSTVTTIVGKSGDTTTYVQLGDLQEHQLVLTGYKAGKNSATMPLQVTYPNNDIQVQLGNECWIFYKNSAGFDPLQTCPASAPAPTATGAR